MGMIENLIEKLHKGIVSFTYLKKDGTKRHAEGTLYRWGTLSKAARLINAPMSLITMMWTAKDGGAL